MKRSFFITLFTVLLVVAGSLLACQPGKNRESNTDADRSGQLTLATQLEESLFEYILNPWYPRVMDTIHGGYHSEFNRDWSPGEGSGEKALVQQARHVWATSRICEAYPEKEEFLKYAAHGFHFLRDAMWDQEFGGFHAYCTKEGEPVERSINDKRIYGQAFALYGLSQYFRMSKNPGALRLAKKAFLWMEEHAHDKQYGGYFETLRRDGTPVLPEDAVDTPGGFGAGLKDYNSSIHIMEAFTELYLVWPDDLVRERLEEMFLLIRDTFVHPDGYLQLYFQADWTHLSPNPAEEEQGRMNWFFNHFTYGHDVETAFLLLETAHVLGWGGNEKTHHAAKQLVDHSLASGWDTIAGGFFDAGVAGEKGIRIVNNYKSWEHIDTYLIDKTYGGWYNNATDTYPDNVDQGKSHIWKTSYHNARGMLNCIKMLRSLEQPNIVFILADDMGHSDPGCYGSEILETPNIDALASNGLRFTNFYNTGRCWPTRTSLLSGYYPHQILSDPIHGVDYKASAVQPVNTTWLPSILQEHGYRCYHSGKWHIVRKVPEQSEMSHIDVGFDHSYRTKDGRHLQPHLLWEDGKEISVPEPGSGYEASVAIVDYAIKYLKEHKQKSGDEPFFEYIAFIAPHFPLQAMQKDIDMYREKFLMGWDEIRTLRTENRKELGFDVHRVNALEPERFAPWNLTPEELITQIDSAETGRAIPWNNLTEKQKEFQATKMAIHAAMVTRMDREIGRYMAALKELGYFENTILFFCSDNGASTEIMNRANKHTIGALPGSADTYLCLGPGWSSAANTPFRLHKIWVHEGGIATPMVVHWPQGIQETNAFRNIPAHVIDIAPTILELAGADPSELNGDFEAPGISLVPFLIQDIQIERPPLFFHHERKKALRHGNWKITTIKEDGEWELYDLSKDRGETNNLTDQNPEKLDELVSLWEAQRKRIIEQTGGTDTTTLQPQ